jgi:membrane-bound metal-dependent hydrolase YbcI (DUF457 family)
MDNLTHSLVGLTSAKAGLGRLSPYATAVCIASANAADLDFISLFFGDRWTLLQNHRGITHSIVGTVAISVLVPTLFFAFEKIVARLRGRSPRIRFRGLLTASMITAATHPVMDWTNNYGVRPLLPWNGRWFYADWVFIVDPYIWLVLGGAAFLLTATTRFKTSAWAVLGSFVTALILLAARQQTMDGGALSVAGAAWVAGILFLIALRVFGAEKRARQSTAIAALALVAIYWGGLALVHRAAHANTLAIAGDVANRHGEKFIRAATMPMLATPLRWQAVAETDRAIYRFSVGVKSQGTVARVDEVDRFEKPTGQAAEIVALAEGDRRAQVLLGFARFPLAKVADTNCTGRTLVQIADLRYTEPGAARGNFAVNIPVDCPAR